METVWDTLRSYGGDAEGVEKRFAGDAELFEVCLAEFREDGDFEEVAEAIQAGDLRHAYECAHSLKGVSANLGLTPFYEVVSVLVESLRSGCCENVQQELAQVLSARETLPR